MVRPGSDLRWRLAATGAALAAGTIDVARARLISEATAPLSDELARAVEARVQLPGWTLTQPDPGVFHLTTPAGRTYITRPDTYPT